MSNRNARLLRDLERLRLPELQTRFRLIVGEETRCPNRTFLLRRIREALDAQAAAPEGPATAAPTPDESEAASTPLEAIEAPPPPVDEDAPSESALEHPAPGEARGAALADAGPSIVEQSPATAAPSPLPAPVRSSPTAWSRAGVQRARAAKVAAERVNARAVRGRFSSMTVEELQTLYLSVVGRKTGSDDRRYLIWKIREAEKGRIPVGPRETRTPAQQADSDMRILPLRLDARRVAAIDATWRARGMRSRMDFLRQALAHYLARVGAPGAAALFESP